MSIKDFDIDCIIGSLFITSLTGTVIFVAYLFFKDINREKFDLIKEDWECTDSVPYIYTTYITVGKVSLPQMHTSTLCINWRHK